MKTWDYREHLRTEYDARRLKNPRYSLRAFARQLGVGKTTLADVLGARRGLSPKNAVRVAERLPLTPSQRARFLSQVASDTYEPPTSVTYQVLADDTFRLIADWYHLALLSLSRLPNASADPGRLAARLGITPAEARQAVERLRRLGYVRVVGGRLKRSVRPLHAGDGPPSDAVRRYHRQALELARASLERDPIAEREFSAITMPIDPAQLPEAKRRIAAFKRRLAELLQEGRPSRVYSLTVQLFPLTREEKA